MWGRASCYHADAMSHDDRPWTIGPDRSRVAWALDYYAEEGPRQHRWFVPGVRRYHRTFATLLNGLIEAGLVRETEDGEVRSFDDPGCLLASLAARPEPVRALWFHHLREDRWLTGEQVAFEETSGTPMGYGLGAVDAGAPGALSLEQARARVAARSGARP